MIALEPDGGFGWVAFQDRSAVAASLARPKMAAPDADLTRFNTGRKDITS